MSGPRGQSRERLLNAAVHYLGTRGISDLSLRQLADALGTSHRMLIYHFGSKEGLVTEVLNTVARSQRAWWTQLLTTTEEEWPRRLWRATADPALEPYARLFFELYGHALQGRAPARTLFEQDIEYWLESAAAALVEAGVPADRARALARLAVATARGLMLDLLATGNRAAVDDAFELFVDWYRRSMTPAARA
ncbi:TetR/AcrR family transcriptional regulator [Pseudonocardia eucalypti]|uniref:TetR/AcrR family transcriptional regulator n=1 Tax=Pseudonocardia eucalypti TaxID=648755 RepID=A0ABP9QZE2_9PSEU|nr:AcrR family transcriptional regulator [Pseudonocardia eucalypti]